MKKITKIKTLNEFLANEPQIKPEIKPAQPKVEPKIKPTTPPQPKKSPAPKNKTFLGLVTLMMERFEKLKSVNEAEDSETGLDPKLNKEVKAGTTKDNQLSTMRKQMEVANIAELIGQLESQYDTKLLEDACEEIIREIFGNNDERFNISDINFDLTINRDGNGGGGGNPEGMKSNKNLGANPAAVQKRRFANFITQGFSFNTFSKLFDKDVNKAIEFIDVEIMKLYFRYFEKMNDANSGVDIDVIRQVVAMLENMPPEQALAAMGGGQSSVVQGQVEVNYDAEKPTIIAQAGNMITLFHEAVKGVFELVSHWGLAGYNEEELEKIYAETEGWVEEYRAFKFGGNIVKAFITFLNTIAQEIDGKDADYVAYPTTLAWLYNSENVSDEKFVDLMEGIVSGKPSDEHKQLGERAYKAAHGVESKEPQDEDEIVSNMSMDDLLDKISKTGMKSLSDAEKARLNQLSSDGISEGSLIALRTSKRKFAVNKAELFCENNKVAAYYLAKRVVENEDCSFEFDKRTVSANDAYDKMIEKNITFVMNPSKTDSNLIEVTTFNTTDAATAKSTLGIK